MWGKQMLYPLGTQDFKTVNPKTLEYWAKSSGFISGKDSIALPPPCNHVLLGKTHSIDSRWHIPRVSLT